MIHSLGLRQHYTSVSLILLKNVSINQIVIVDHPIVTNVYWEVTVCQRQC